MQKRIKVFVIVLFSFISAFLFSQSDKIAEIDNLLKLEDKAFFEALDKFSTQYYYHLSFGNNKSIVNKSYSLSDTLKAYWALLEKIINSKPENHHDGFGATRSLEHIVYEMVKIAGESEYPKLLKYYNNVPDGNYFKYGSFLLPLCNARIKREIDYIIENKIKSESKFLPSKQNVVTLPPESVPADLQENWYLFKSLEAHYKDKMSQDTTCDWYYVQKHYDLFLEKVEEILKSEAPNQLNEVLRFNWGGWCGTGSESFYSERQIAVLIILLRERDYEAILGNPDFIDNLGNKNFRKLIELSGYDWIGYYSGVICEGKYCGLSPEFYRQGGDKAARTLIQLKNYEFKDVYQRQCYLNLCNYFLKKEKKYDYFPDFDFFSNPFYSDEYENDYEYRVAVSERTKDELLDAIIDVAKDEDNTEIAKTVIRILGGIDFNQKIKEQLLNYTKSQFKSVRDAAAKIFRNNGIAVSLPEDDGKIKFRILVDGVPLSNFNLAYELEGSSSNFGYYSRNGKTTEKGIFNLNKDELLETKKDNPRIRFSSNSGAGKSQMFFFCTEMIMPKNISDTIDVLITTGKLRINFNLNRNKNFYENKQMSIYLSGRLCQLHYLELTNIVQESYILPPQIQQGNYYISVSIPGSKDWHESFEINKDTTTLLANLVYGTSVTFQIKAPGGEKSDDEVWFELINNNQKNDYFFIHYNYNLGGYESLPTGSYTLKIFSSKEKKEQIKSNTRGKCSEIIPDFTDYDGKEIDFLVNDDSPETIDLGVIELKPTDE